MRTTLNIDEDVLAAAKELSQMRGCSMGRVVSDLCRAAIFTGTNITKHARSAAGFRTIPCHGNVVTEEVVNAFREIEGI
jgi:hypothetical protein